MYDVIVVGARVAGASTAMLLARRGLKVLCVDKARFPSETISNHQIHVPGVARLKRWGLLDAVIAANTPATREVRFDTGRTVLEGRFPPFQGADALYGPRRTILDKILVDAARASGAEVREDFVVEGLAFADRRVTGVRSRTSGGRSIVESAPLVVGADGKRSVVAKAVGAATYFEKRMLSAAYYAYWDGVHLARAECYERHRRYIGAWPTNDGLTVIYLALPISEFADFRSDVAGNILKTLDLAGDLGQRVRAGRQVGWPRGSANLPNRFRKPYGSGWSLVGDAGLVMDPLTGQGISHALRDAELVSDAIEAGLGGRCTLGHAMQAYEKERNRQSLAMYKLTTRQAELERGRRPELEVLYETLQGNQPGIDEMLGVLAGSVPLSEYQSPLHLLRLLGFRGLAAVALRTMLGTTTSPRSSPGSQ